MLVFKDLEGQVWQISKVDETGLNFDEVTDENAEDVNFFKPSQE